MPLIGKFRYRPEVDGLRAVAVVAVVLFHAGGFHCYGGYVGVDVFFVISGFLITSLIWKDLESAKFTFRHFWERRARRIVPAMVVVTVATLMAGWFLLLPGDYKNLGKAAAAQAVFAANINYVQDNGYFAGEADEKPLLHTWSLAVEEQFYLFVPFLMWGMFRFEMLRRRAAVISLLATVFLLSFAASVYGVAHFPLGAFYLLPTRAWELLTGALVAFLPANLLPLRSRIVRELSAFAGLVLILLPVFFYSISTPFPGLAALPPCLGAALIIWANERDDTRLPTVIGKALSIRPVVFIGLISYSLYLWHWPFLAFNKYVTLVPPGLGQRFVMRGVMLSLGFFASVLSWRYVETPFRTRKFGASRKSVFAFAGTGLVVVLVAGLLCMFMQGFPQRIPAQAQEYANAQFEGTFNYNLTINDLRADKLVPIGMTDPARPPTVLLWGDSHGMAALPAVDAYLKEKGIAGRAITHAATAPVLNWFTVSQFGLNKEAIPFNDAVVSYIRSRQISSVIIIANWSGYAEIGGRDFSAALLATVRQIVAARANVWIMLSVPSHAFDVPRIMSRSVISHSDITPFQTTTAALDKFDKIDPAVIAQMESAGVRILDPKPRFLDPTGQRYVFQSDGVILYRDKHHLTPRGANLMLLPFFRSSLTLE